MNIFDIKYRHIRHSVEDSRIHNLLLPTFTSYNNKRSLLLDIPLNKDIPKKPSIIGMNVKLRRPSTNPYVQPYTP